ncbi:polysaccharide biosynthesis C-terminal domain-containing protein [Priestia aryabhattai]|uniref:oligosaccharide flippase family protein n=1 Tax=Priestia aryabhattai TaxID=412384 RepID=UPI003D290D4E
MSSYSKLAKSSFIFAIGNIGSKFIYLFLVPIYTFYLSSEEYGRADLISTTLSLLIPVFSLSVFDAVLRFSMEKKEEDQLILTNGILVCIVGFLLAVIFYPLFLYALPFDGYMVYFYILLFLQLINSTLLQFLRAIGKLKAFAVNGILCALIVLIANLIFIIGFHMGIIGFLISLIMSNVVSLCYLSLVIKVHRYFKIKLFSKKISKEMLIYSIPLIPNAVMWWVMSASDRYIVTYFLGLSANGLYAVATKIPSILNIINSVFLQAWQLSAIEETDSKNKADFYNNVFKILSISMIISTSIILLFLKFAMNLLVSEDYYLSWKYVPFLLVGIVFSSFSSFLGASYIATKNTNGIFKTSIIGGAINLVLNLVLVPLIGINGAGTATMLSFFTMWIIRYRETKKVVGLSIEYKKYIILFFVLFIQILTLYINIQYQWLLNFMCLLIIIVISKKEILSIFSQLSKVRKKIKF